MVVAWLITLPCAAVVGAVCWAIAHVVGGMAGVLVVFAILCGLALVMWLRSRRQPIDASNVTADWDDSLAPTPGASETVPGEGRS